MLAEQMKKDIPSLDGIRAIAVMIVFVAHSGLETVVPGGFGVTAFFFLSGFLITTLFIREQAKYQSVDLPAFYLRRLARLTPPLLITLIIAYVGVALSVVPGGSRPSTIASQALYFFNYFYLYGPKPTDGAGGTGVLWSLAVEEHFYLIYPLIFILLAAMKRNRSRLYFLAALLLLNLVWRYLLVTVIGAPSNHTYMASDARLDSILYGCFLAVLAWDGRADRLFPSTTLGLSLTTAAAVGLLLFTFIYRDEMFRQTVRYSLQGIALIPLLHYAVRFPDLPHHRILNTRPFVVIGTYSYTIYLGHHVIIKTLETVPSFPSSFLAVFAASFLLTMLYSAVMYRFVDTPMAAVRHRLRGHRSARASSRARPRG